MKLWIERRFSSPNRHWSGRQWAAAWLGALFLLCAAGGCGRHASHTSDSRLQEIDETLNRDLPPGTAMARVVYYLNSRGHTIEAPPSPDTVVAVIHHVDAKAMEMVTARVTFHFDRNNKLITYELAPAP